MTQPAFDIALAQTEFCRDVLQGLEATRKTLPCKYFYDERGSKLFEQICELPEYYVTRTELKILKRHLPDMAECIGAHAQVLEFGTGAGLKTQMLLEALPAPKSYTPIDISQSALDDALPKLCQQFSSLTIRPICADYTQPSLFARLQKRGPFCVFFPGSTLGNFDRNEAVRFLTRLTALAGKEGGILLGVDMMKEHSILKAAYDDSQGVTAAFNKNLLVRINNELDGNFDLDAFAHKAIVNAMRERVEMHLVSMCDQSVRVAGKRFTFAQGETIHTENSHKYTTASLGEMARLAGLRIAREWHDEDDLFGVYYLKAK